MRPVAALMFAHIDIPQKYYPVLARQAKCPRQQAEAGYGDPRKDKSRRRSDGSFSRIRYRRGFRRKYDDIHRVAFILAYTLQTGFDRDGYDRGARLSPFVRTCCRQVKTPAKAVAPRAETGRDRRRSASKIGKTH